MIEGATVTAIYQGDAALREQIKAAMSADKRLSQAAVAKEAGISAATLNQWLSGKYAGDNEAIDAKLRLWLDAYQTRQANDRAMPEAPAYVPTPTSMRVLSALSYAQMAGDIAVAYGAAGVGKTTACKQHRDANPNVWIATMSPATSGVVTALQEVAESLGLDSSGGARVVAKRIERRVEGTRGLLIIDEAQHLSVPALDELRGIHDATGIGVALVGNEGVFARMAGGRNAAQLDRLYSRVGKRLRLAHATEADIQAVIKAWGVLDNHCHAALVRIARGAGALRALTKTLRLASMYALAESRAVNPEDVRAAASELVGGAA